jgi:hypothetical protein
LVSQAYHRNLMHLRMLQLETFVLHWIGILVADLKRVFAAPQKMDVAIGKLKTFAFFIPL